MYVSGQNETLTLDLSDGDTYLELPGRYASGSIQISWSGLNSADSSIFIQGSNNGMHWDSLVAYVAVTLIDPAGHVTWEIPQRTMRFIRLGYTANGNSAGSCTITVWGY